MVTSHTHANAPETIVLHVEGMTCGHCEKHVSNALGALPGVSVLSVSRQDSTAVVTVEGTPDERTLVDAVKSAGYDARVARVI